MSMGLETAFIWPSETVASCFFLRAGSFGGLAQSFFAYLESYWGQTIKRL